MSLRNATQIHQEIQRLGGHKVHAIQNVSTSGTCTENPAFHSVPVSQQVYTFRTKFHPSTPCNQKPQQTDFSKP